MTSPSSWGREQECLASTVLPHSRSTGPAAGHGTNIHAYITAHAQAKTDEERAEALLEVPEESRPHAEAIDWSRMPNISPETGVAELALAWSPSTGKVRELGRGGAVEHDDVAGLLQGDEIGGIVDWCALTEDAIFVTDWKTGWKALVRAEVSRQLGAYAVWAARLFGREKAIVSYARLFDNGQVAWDIAEVDSLRLDSVEAALRQHLKKVEAAQLAYRNDGIIPPTVEGDHCTYCPALRFCPAKAALLLSVLSEDPSKPARLAKLPEPLNHDVVSRLWPQLRAAEALLKKLKKDCRDYVRVYGAVKLPSGNILGHTESETRSIDPVFARPVLEELFGPEGANMAIKEVPKLTWKSLNELCQAHSSRGKTAKLERDVTAKLEGAGAIRSVTIRGVSEVSAKSKKLRLRAQDEEKPKALEDGEED